MAWRSSGRTNHELIENLSDNGIVKSENVRQAMLGVDRAHYITRGTGGAYFDAPQSIGWSATISAPHMHAHALELLKDHLLPGMAALDVGSGSGYLTVCIAQMVDVEGGGGKVVGIDYLKPLVDFSIENVKRDRPELLENPNFMLKVGDGWKGDAENGPYNAIHVGAAAAKLPQTLADQLVPGGRMIIPIGPPGGFQQFYQIDKALDGKISRKPLFGVSYVPLVEEKNGKDNEDKDDEGEDDEGEE